MNMSPRYARNFPTAFINIDRVFEGLFDLAQDKMKLGGFPFHDIIKVDDTSYRFVFALAGYSRDEIEIEQQGDELTVRAAKVSSDSKETYLYRGIAKSSFTRVFKLARHTVVKGADMKDGLLTIDVKIEIPEEQKPRKIEIVTGSVPVQGSADAAVKDAVET